jgi:hypothetical protein
MGELMGKIDRRNKVEGLLQNRFNTLNSSIKNIIPRNESQKVETVTREKIMGKPEEWKFKDHRQPASDLTFTQNGKSVRLKTYLPGSYWIYFIEYSRKNLDKGVGLKGISENNFIYIPTFADGTIPTQLENDTANIIAIHEAAHEVDDKNNEDMYKKLFAKLDRATKYNESKYMPILREIKTRQEIGASELLLQTLINMQKDGINIFSGSYDQFSSLFLGGLRSQSYFLNIELPKEVCTPVRCENFI